MTHAAFYPEIAPYDSGLLEVGDNQLIYWETCGNPDGKPVVVLHGGPGSGCSATMRRYFDPDAYCIILFDQRNCGRSKPHASDPNVDLSTNTTQHLITDIERLREYLGVERWVVYGNSWGSTLALAYAEQHPDRVTVIILVGVTMTRQSEIDWLTRGVAPLFPEQWARFRAGVPEAERDGDLVAAYYRLINDPDPVVRAKAAQDWHDWDNASLVPNPAVKLSPPEFVMARSRIVTHYFYHKAWLEEGILLRQAAKLANIPGIMIQGRLDLGSPLVTAWELEQVWTKGELLIVQGGGHSPNDPGMAENLIAVTNYFGQVG